MAGSGNFIAMGAGQEIWSIKPWNSKQRKEQLAFLQSSSGKPHQRSTEISSLSLEWFSCHCDRAARHCPKTSHVETAADCKRGSFMKSIFCWDMCCKASSWDAGLLRVLIYTRNTTRHTWEFRTQHSGDIPFFIFFLWLIQFTMTHGTYRLNITYPNELLQSWQSFLVHEQSWIPSGYP